MLTQDDLRSIGTLMDDKLKKQSGDFDQKLEKQKNEIIQAVADTIHDSLLPLLDNHEERIERLEKNSGLTPLPMRGQ